MAATKTKAKAKPGKATQRRKKATFYSRSPNQRLTFEAGDVVRNERGRVIESIPSKSIEFEDNGAHGVYVWDPSDKEREDWERSPEFLDWLRAHPKINTGREGAFWERGAAPDEPQPKLSEQLDAIGQGLFDRDREAIEAVLQAERESHNRDVVLDAGDSALHRLDGGGTDPEPSPEPSQTS